MINNKVLVVTDYDLILSSVLFLFGIISSLYYGYKFESEFIGFGFVIMFVIGYMMNLNTYRSKKTINYY